MKLSLLREKLNQKYHFNFPPLTLEESHHLDQIKVIGITGSKGKSTTAYLLHKYMEKMHLSHQVYCSISEGSEQGNINKRIGVDVPLKSDKKIFFILEELKDKPVEYLILEVSERAIFDQITDDIDFELKVLTNILKKHNKMEFNEAQYVALKLSFLKNSKDNIIGLTEDVTKEMIETVTKQNGTKPIIYSTRFLAKRKNVMEQDIKYVLYEISQKLEGFRFQILQDNKPYAYQTNLLFKHNALNLACLIAIIDTLGIYNQVGLSDMLKQIQILAREETFQYDGRMILVGTSLIPVLEELSAMQKENIIKGKIIVVTGSPGLGFAKWKTNEYDVEERKTSRKFAMQYAKEYADKVYITEADSAATPFSVIASELVSFLDDTIPCVVEKDRYLAIQKAILEAEENDVIYVAGRGNRALLYDQQNTSRYFNDLEVVKEIIERKKENGTINDK